MPGEGAFTGEGLAGGVGLAKRQLDGAGGQLRMLSGEPLVETAAAIRPGTPHEPAPAGSRTRPRWSRDDDGDAAADREEGAADRPGADPDKRAWAGAAVATNAGNPRTGRAAAKSQSG